MTKQEWQEIANKYTANQKLLDSMDEDKSKSFKELRDAVQEALWMLSECNDLYVSDIRKLQKAFWDCKHAFDCEPSDYQLEKFEEYGVEWPIKKKTKGK